MNKYFETLFKFVDKHFILIAIFLTILNIYFFTKREEYFTTESKNVESSSKTESRTEGNVESRTEGNVESRTECRTENRTENRTEGNVESRTECRTENRNVESKPWNYVKMYIYRTDPRDDLYNIYSKLIENKTNAEKKSILRKWERKIKKHLQGLAITLATATERLRHSTGQKKDNLDDRIERWTSRIQQLKNTKIKIQAAISKISSE